MSVVTAAPCFRNAALSSLPVVALALASGTVQIMLCPLEVAPCWSPPHESPPPAILLGAVDLGFTGGAAPLLVLDPWTAFPPTLVLAHSTLVAAVSVRGLDVVERRLSQDADAADEGWGAALSSEVGITAEVLVSVDASKPGSKLSSAGLAGASVVSTPALGRLFLAWLSAGSSAVINLSVLNARYHTCALSEGPRLAAIITAPTTTRL